MVPGFVGCPPKKSSLNYMSEVWLAQGLRGDPLLITKCYLIWILIYKIMTDQQRFTAYKYKQNFPN